MILTIEQLEELNVYDIENYLNKHLNLNKNFALTNHALYDLANQFLLFLPDSILSIEQHKKNSLLKESLNEGVFFQKIKQNDKKIYNYVNINKCYIKEIDTSKPIGVITPPTYKLVDTKYLVQLFYKNFVISYELCLSQNKIKFYKTEVLHNMGYYNLIPIDNFKLINVYDYYLFFLKYGLQNNKLNITTDDNRYFNKTIDVSFFNEKLKNITTDDKIINLIKNELNCICCNTLIKAISLGSNIDTFKNLNDKERYTAALKMLLRASNMHEYEQKLNSNQNSVDEIIKEVTMIVNEQEYIKWITALFNSD